MTSDGDPPVTPPRFSAVAAIAVSTEGASPMLAQWATRRIVHTLDPTVASLADLLADQRAEGTESGAEIDRPVGNGQVEHALDLRRDDE